MVGAVIEEVAPKPAVPRTDAILIALLLLVSAGLHTWIIRHTAVTARDSMRFARIALNLESPGSRGVREVLRDSVECPDPPLFPLMVLATSKLIAASSALDTPERMLFSAQLAANLTGVLLVIPTYWLGRSVFSNRFAGFAGAIVFQTLPTVLQITSDGLSDSTSLFFVACGLLAGIRAVRTKSTKWFLLAGIASGLGYLVRPEGLLPAAAIGIVAVVLSWKRELSVVALSGRLAALAVGALVVAAPYMVVIGGVSNKPSVNEGLKKLVPLRMLHADAVPTSLFAEWYSGHGSQSQWAVTAIAKETLKASHYGVLLLAIAALVVCRSRFDLGVAVILAAAFVQCVVLFALAMKSSTDVPPYISERHTLPLVMIAAVLCGGLVAYLERCGVVLLVVLVASALPAALKPLHENRAGHYHAGMYLAGKLQPGDAVVDPFEWAHYYAGYSLHGMPPDPPEDQLRRRWVVWEPTAGTKQNPHSRLPRLEAARMIIADGKHPPELMYQWPAENPKVVVYCQIVK